MSSSTANPVVYRGLYNISLRERDCPLPTEPGLIERWGGWLPLSGMLAAIAVSKELLLVDGELLLGIGSTTAMLGYYLAIGNLFTEYMQEQSNKEKAFFDDAHEMTLALLGHYKASQEALATMPTVLKEYAQEYKDAVQRHARAMALKPQLEAREKTVAALTALRNRELQIKVAEQANLVESLLTSLTTDWKTNKALRDELVDYAVEVLASPNTTRVNPFQRTLDAKIQELEGN
jgi:uncharacterized coiled-coil protein SlyX